MRYKLKAVEEPWVIEWQALAEAVNLIKKIVWAYLD